MPTIPQIRAEFIRSIIGRCLTDVVAAGASSCLKWEIRVAKEDGEEFLITRDFRARRIDVEVESGIVVRAI
jgi:hypothetical protein